MAWLVDFHTHFFSRCFFETLAQGSPLDGTPERRIETVARAAGLDLPDPSTAKHLKRWTDELDRYGVRRWVSFASVPEEASVLEEAVSLARGRMSAFLVVDPTRPGAATELEGYLASGSFRGALLFPALHGYRPDSGEALEVYEVLARQRGTVVVHCGLLNIALRDRFELPRRYDVSLANPLHLVPVADTYPTVRFVIPHFGAGFFRETLMAGAQCSNLYVDTSSSNSWTKTLSQPLELADVFERALGVFGPRRILFGTDSSTFPRGWRHDLFVAQREALGACGVSEEDREWIFGTNAVEMLHLGPRVPS